MGTKKRNSGRRKPHEQRRQLGTIIYLVQLDWGKNLENALGSDMAGAGSLDARAFVFPGAVGSQ